MSEKVGNLGFVGIDFILGCYIVGKCIRVKTPTAVPCPPFFFEDLWLEFELESHLYVAFADFLNHLSIVLHFYRRLHCEVYPFLAKEWDSFRFLR